VVEEDGEEEDGGEAEDANLREGRKGEVSSSEPFPLLRAFF